MGVMAMSQKERRRLELLAQVRKKQLSLVEAAALLPLSYRQCKRVWKRFHAEGAAGLVHRLRGKPSTHGKPPAERQQALALVRERYADFGPTLAAEMLAKHHALAVHPETLRRWRMADGQWQRHRRRSPHRQWRQRKAHCGELVQLDGSHHDWFEGRAAACVLLVLVDDATSRTFARFYPTEDTRAAFDGLSRYYDRYGLPQALYPDQDSIYQVNAESYEAGTPRPLTQFGRAMQTLGVGLQCAHSPQAKGRVERRHQVFQDRLVKELRVAGIRSLAAANQYLDETFLPELNARFTVAAASATDLHRKLPRGLRLDEVLCWEESRVVARDWTLSWKGRTCQIDKRHAALSLVGRRVRVRELLDGRRQILHGDTKLTWRELTRPQRPAAAVPRPAAVGQAQPAVRAAAAIHPWRRWGIAAGANGRRAGPSAPATDRSSLKKGSPRNTPPESLGQQGRLAMQPARAHQGEDRSTCVACGGRGRRRG